MDGSIVVVAGRSVSTTLLKYMTESPKLNNDKDSLSTMIVLVDYANVEASLRRRGIVHVVEHILQAAVERVSGMPERAKFRFYGGWYDESGPTREAQVLSAELSRSYPGIVRLVGPPGTTDPIRVQSELAYAILSQPACHLLNTYRKKNSYGNLRVRPPSELGCTSPTCGLRHIKKLVKRNSCPEPECRIRGTDILWRAEQKLVDVMLATDLLHSVSSGLDDTVVVVSSDEDLWPAILHSVNTGAKVVHVQAKANRRTPVHYCGHHP